MARTSKTSKKTSGRYWTTPKEPVSFRIDAALVEEAKAVAKAYKIPFVQLVVAGMETEIERIKKELRK